MKKFRDHWYAPKAYANWSLVDQKEIAGSAAGHTVTASGNTQGLAAVKPYPFDERGSIRLEEGAITICYGPSLRDYVTGTRKEVADFLRQLVSSRSIESFAPTRYPPIGEYDQWLQKGKEEMQAYLALAGARIALIESLPSAT